MDRALGVLLLLLLAVPTAGAVPGTGSFLLEGAAFVPDGSDAVFRPLFAFNPDATLLRDLKLDAASLTVHLYQEKLIPVTLAGETITTFSPTEDPYLGSETFHDARVRLVGAGQEGFVALYPDPSSSARLLAAGGATVQARDHTRVETALAPADPDEEDPFATEYTYVKVVDSGHVYAEAAGLLHWEGKGIVKLYGPEIEILSREGRRHVATGIDHSTTPGNRTWVLLEFPAATLRVDAAAPWMVGAEQMGIGWDGPAVFTPSHGTFETVDGYFRPTEGPEKLSGRLDGAFLSEDQAGKVVTRMDVTGDMNGQASTLLYEPKPFPQRILGGAGFQPLAFGLVLAVGAGVGGGVWLVRRRKSGAPPAQPLFTVDECIAHATEAADDEDWPRATLWLRRLRPLAPTSARVCADLAHALCQLGEREEALKLYEEASRLSYDGEADFNGAVLALELGRSLDEVEAWLERALRRTPAYVVDIEGDPLFRPLKGRPRYDRGVAEAWRQVEDLDGGQPASAGA